MTSKTKKIVATKATLTRSLSEFHSADTKSNEAAKAFGAQVAEVHKMGRLEEWLNPAIGKLMLKKDDPFIIRLRATVRYRTGEANTINAVRGEGAHGFEVAHTRSNNSPRTSTPNAVVSKIDALLKTLERSSMVDAEEVKVLVNIRQRYADAVMSKPVEVKAAPKTETMSEPAELEVTNVSELADLLPA